MTADTTHECLPGLCPRRIPAHMLFCPTHWYQVPADLREVIWATWDHGRGQGSPEHMTVIGLAADAVRAKARQQR